MKLSFLIVLTALLQVSAATKAQKINLEKNNIRLTQAVKLIADQVGYSVFYNDELPSLADQQITVHIKQSVLESALNECFRSTPYTYLINGKTILVVEKTKRETQSVALATLVTGLITDENGQPMPGVTVAVKNTSTQTVSGNNGRYSITIPESNSVLVFTFVGYQSSELSANGKSIVNISLKPTLTELSTVTVNVGYQAIRKSDVTGAISSVKSSELNLTTPTLGQALVGKVAGVQISDRKSVV